LIEEGGDWDRLNRLKVYKGLNLLNSRQFGKAGELLVDSLSTYTASELIDYSDFVGLAIIVNVLSLKRVDLKKKVCFNRIHKNTARSGPLTCESGHE
jgi:26S proteasome regulatory subunit N7